MRTALRALALACALPSLAHAMQPLPTVVTVHPDWSAGYEAAYLDLCQVTPTERAAWASVVPMRAARLDQAEYASGFMSAIEDADAYEEAGFDRIEYCGDNHP